MWTADVFRPFRVHVSLKRKTSKQNSLRWLPISILYVIRPASYHVLLKSQHKFSLRGREKGRREAGRDYSLHMNV